MDRIIRAFPAIVIDGKEIDSTKEQAMFNKMFESVLEKPGLAFDSFLHKGVKIEDFNRIRYLIEDIVIKYTYPKEKEANYGIYNLYLDVTYYLKKIDDTKDNMPNLLLKDTKGNHLDKDQFGACFNDGLIAPGIGTTIVDRNDKKWSVKDIEVKSIKVNNTKEVSQWTFILYPKNSDIHI